MVRTILALAEELAIAELEDVIESLEQILGDKRRRKLADEGVL